MRPFRTWIVPGVIAAMSMGGWPMAGEAGTKPRHCGPVTKVSSLPALVALAPRDWAKRTDTPTTITPDITPTVALTVHVRDFLPEGRAPEGRPVRGIDIRGAVPGLSYSGGTVSIRPGTTFRIRFDMAPFLPISSSAPRMTFEAPCRADCGERERRCAADDACYEAGREYCEQCSNESPERCACVAPDGSDRADGTSCSYSMRGADVGPASGQCRAGTCALRPR
jgi:hypothetical protein